MREGGQPRWPTLSDIRVIQPGAMMRRGGPLLTLLAGGAVAVVLLVASMLAAGERVTPELDDAGDVGAFEPGQTAPPSPPAEQQTPQTPAPTPSLQPGSDEEAAGEAEQVDLAYVGWVDGNGATVAIVVVGDEATAYVCDGDDVEAWLTGSAAGGAMNLTGDDARLTASFDEQSATGETTVGDQTFTFTIEQVDPPAGLYRVAETIPGAEVAGGWILLADGTQIGVLTVNGVQMPAPPLDVESRQVTVSGVPLTADRVGE